MKKKQMNDNVTDGGDHGDAEEHLLEELSWPQYFVSGEGVEDFTPAYYRVEGPNGPVSYKNPNTGPYPTTMYEFAMEAQSESFRSCEIEDTPWSEMEVEQRKATMDQNNSPDDDLVRCDSCGGVVEKDITDGEFILECACRRHVPEFGTDESFSSELPDEWVNTETEKS